MIVRFRRRSAMGTALAVVFAASSMAALAQGEAPQPRQWRNFPQAPVPPKGAPNVLLIMTDDVGFGSSSTFGGAIPTPNFDALAERGLRYNAFHTTAMCSPTRAALLTGRNAHAVASGSITNVAVDEPGYTSVIPRSAATVGRVLRDAGYDTAFFGKNHNTPLWQSGPFGPFDNWPNGWGFDYFYGFNGAATDQFRPNLIENRNAVEPANDPGYTLDRDMTDHLIHWMRMQRVERPDHPFFAYLAPGTMHSPHGAPPEWIARFKGRFDEGWDKLREHIFERQKATGIIPADARLSPRPSVLPAWDSLSPAARAAYAHQMEIAAAQLAYFDDQTGRIFAELRASGQLDNTLVIYIQGDNGASMDSQRGAVQELASLQGIEASEDELVANSALDGTTHSYSNYNAAWAWAQNAPFPWGKQIASHLGGLRDGMVISWPARITPDGKVRTQFHHVIDVAPTIYEAAGIAPPEEVDGVRQQPIDGVSMVYSFTQPGAPSTHHEQYFEMLGNRSYYRDGWLASTTPPRAPFDRSPVPLDPTTFQWELYDLNHDFAQATNVAARYPGKLAELRAAFDQAAAKYHVYPLAADLIGRVGPGNRPATLPSAASYTFYPGPTRYFGGSFPGLGVGWDLVASIVTGPAAQGPVVVMGDEAGGAGLLLDGGRPLFVYNPTGRAEQYQTLAGSPLTTGSHEVVLSVAADPAAGQRAARITLTVDGRADGSLAVPVYYGARGEGVVGRYGTRTLHADLANPPAQDLTIAKIEFRRR